MNHVQEIAARYKMKLDQKDLEKAVSLACSISKASLVERNGIGDAGRLPSTNHDPTDHIYWETRENVMESIRNSNIKVAQIIRMHEYSCSYMTQKEVIHYASTTWDDVKSKIVILTEVMES